MRMGLYMCVDFGLIMLSLFNIVLINYCFTTFILTMCNYFLLRDCFFFRHLRKIYAPFQCVCACVYIRVETAS